MPERFIDYARYGFAPTTLPSTPATHGKDSGRGYMGWTGVVLGVDDVGKVVRDVSKELGRRGQSLSSRSKAMLISCRSHDAESVLICCSRPFGESNEEVYRMLHHESSQPIRQSTRHEPPCWITE
jgi:hypothetical protein